MTKSRGIRIQRGTRTGWATENQGRFICECGCAEPVTLRPEHYPDPPRFVHGHNSRGITRGKPKPEPQPCECECGELASAGKRYVVGHGGRGRKRSAETRAKLSASKLGNRNPMYGKAAPNRLPPKASSPCACGCGGLATPGRHFITGHNGRGQRLSNYTGRYVSAYHGYAFVDVPEHPYANKGYVAEHRIVVERHLRENDPTSELLVAIGENLYLSPEIVVHHINGVKDDNRLENLAPMTNQEHVRLHHDQGDIHHH